MNNKFRNFIVNTYMTNGTRFEAYDDRDDPIQIDDQDDYDNITEFCNIFVTINVRNEISLELIGSIPITKDLADLAQKFNGYAHLSLGKIVLKLKMNQVESIMDLASKIKQTSDLGAMVNNQNWHKISSRTVSSLYRFVRVIREFKEEQSLVLTST